MAGGDCLRYTICTIASLTINTYFLNKMFQEFLSIKQEGRQIDGFHKYDMLTEVQRYGVGSDNEKNLLLLLKVVLKKKKNNNNFISTILLYFMKSIDGDEGGGGHHH